LTINRKDVPRKRQRDKSLYI